MLYACPPKKFHCRRALYDFEKGDIFLQAIYQLWSPTRQRPCFQNNAPVGRHPDHTMAPFAAGVNPVRNSSPAIAGLETERGIISNGVKNKYFSPYLILAHDELL